MSVVPRTTLKSYFETGDCPTQSQFVNLIDSLSNVSDGFLLASATVSGATSIPVDRPVAPVTAVGYIKIDPYSLLCEIRKITGASASAFTITQPLRHAHAAGVRVVFVDSDTISFAEWGALDDGSDAEPAIQAGLDDQWFAGGIYWLTGQGKVFRVSRMLMLSSQGRIQSWGVEADPGFAPADTNNAVIMSSQGAILAFTVATSGIFTTPTAHGIPGTNVPLMFKRITGSSGLVAGRIYYSRDVVGLTFKVSSTVGGAAITISTSGSGTLYAEVSSMSRVYLRDVLVKCSHVAGLNGVDLVLQQPADDWKLRVQDCEATGFKLSGQDGVFWNLMLINCRVALLLNSAILFKFYAWNIEQCGTGVISENGSGSNEFRSGHVEMKYDNDPYGLTTSRVFTGIQGGVIIDTLAVSMDHADQVIFENTGVPANSGYELRNITCAGSVDITMVKDDSRGYNKKVWSDFRNLLVYRAAPTAPTSSSYPDEPRWGIIGKNGRHVLCGSVDAAKPVFDIQADTDQTGEILVVRGKTGAKVAAISPDGDIEVLTVGRGTIQKSADGTRYRIVVANGGALSTTPA